MKEKTFKPSFALSSLERTLFLEFEQSLLDKGYKYLSVPSSVKYSTYQRQDVVALDKVAVLGDNEHALSGSAEQGILEYFSDQVVEEQKLFATNQCFRLEKDYVEFVRLIEFKKTEQFVFAATESKALEAFDEVLQNSIDFLNKHSVKHRVVDMTTVDKGYHHKKYDIEVATKTYGWLETHSCSYFEREQSRRFGIKGAEHTVSNTGIASPRILIPFMESMGILT